MRVTLFCNPQGQQFSVNLPTDGQPFHGHLHFYGDKNQLIAAFVNGKKVRVFKTRGRSKRQLAVKRAARV